MGSGIALGVDDSDGANELATRLTNLLLRDPMLRI
jgi:hypothetical protein